MQIYTGLDLSRYRLDWHACSADGTLVGAGAVPPDSDGLTQLVRRLGDARRAGGDRVDERGAVRPRPARAGGLGGEVADAQRVKGLAPLACKTDRIDAWVLAELSRRDLVPEIWLPDPSVRAERERARFRLHLVQAPHDAEEPHPRRRCSPTGTAARSAICSAGGAARCSSGCELPEPWRRGAAASSR